MPSFRERLSFGPVTVCIVCGSCELTDPLGKPGFREDAPTPATPWMLEDDDRLEGGSETDHGGRARVIVAIARLIFDFSIKHIARFQARGEAFFSFGFDAD